MFEFKNLLYKNILNITSLFIDENKITTLVGQSESGKTTKLKLMNKNLYSQDKIFSNVSVNEK